MNLFIFGWPFLRSLFGSSVTSTMDVNMAPTNIFATAQLTGLLSLDAISSGAVGFTQYTQVDPVTQVPKQVDLSAGQYFTCIGQFSADNVDTVTVFIEAVDGGNATAVQGSFQIYSLG